MKKIDINKWNKKNIIDINIGLKKKNRNLKKWNFYLKYILKIIK